jgi:glycine/betaine/sarcosine/D-proline reductase family selenoprotein B
VFITALPSIAQMVGVNRIVRGASITSPTGDSSLAAGDEARLRRQIVARALEMLSVDVEPATVWDVAS